MADTLAGLKVMRLAVSWQAPWPQTLSDLGLPSVIQSREPAGDDTRQWASFH